ncbi:MAG: cobaltochelatase subunit CobN, partial [Planctomycetota bacterium]
TAIAKEMQTRYLHPQWIRGQQKEGYSGTLQVLKATQFLWGWQAMQPESVREDQWQSMMDVYIKDQYELGTRQWFEESNHQALAQMTERMLEAVRLKYWTPTDENQQLLARVYREASEASGLLEKNQRVSEFVEENFPKPASTKPDPKTIAAESTSATSSDDAEPSVAEDSTSIDTQNVDGIELQAVEDEPELVDASRRVRAFAVVGMLTLILGGALIQILRSASNRG